MSPLEEISILFIHAIHRFYGIFSHVLDETKKFTLQRITKLSNPVLFHL
jgi:hypothetical protein